MKTAIIQKLAELGNPKVAFVGQRASDFLLFKSFIPVDLVICLDYGKDAQLIEKEVPVISLEKKLGVRKIWYSREIEQIFSDETLLAQIKRRLPPGSLLLPYASSQILEDFAKSQGYLLLNNPATLLAKLENKERLYQLKNTQRLPNPSLKVVQLTDVGYEQLTARLGAKFVLQLPKGSSGCATFIIGSRKEFDDVGTQPEIANTTVILTPFIKGPTLSISGVITQNQAITLPPSCQVVGNPETAPRETIFSGIDFAAGSRFGSPQLRETVGKITTYLKKIGFLGAFNLNLMANGLILTDLNPRFMGSGQLTVELQAENGETPLSLLHLMTYLGLEFELSKRELEKIASPKNGSLIVLHSLEKKTKCVRGDLKIGFYRFDDRLRFVKEGYEFSQLQKDEVLIAGAIPQIGKKLEPEAPLLRIFTRESVLDCQTFKLNAKYQKITREAYQMLSLSAP